MGDYLTGCGGPAVVIPDFKKIYDYNLQSLAKFGAFLIEKAAEGDSEEAEHLLEWVSELERVRNNYDKLRPVIQFSKVIEETQKGSDGPEVSGFEQLPLHGACSYRVSIFSYAD